MTDNIYLNLAVRKLTKFHPELYDPAGKPQGYKFSLFKYSELADEVLLMGGGSDGQKNFITHYEKALTRYTHAPLEHPVIIVIDNDNGASGIFSYLNGKSKSTIGFDTTKPFYEICQNLFLVKTPEPGSGKHSCVEDLFPKSLLATKLDGKSFNPAKKIDPAKEYGKVVFAEKVIRPGKDTIDFSGFEPLFDRILAVIKSYKPPHAAT